MNNLFSTAIILSIFYFAMITTSCSKETAIDIEIDPRDEIIGTYDGIMYYKYSYSDDLNSFQYDSTYQTSFIVTKHDTIQIEFSPGISYFNTIYKYREDNFYQDGNYVNYSSFKANFEPGNSKLYIDAHDNSYGSSSFEYSNYYYQFEGTKD